MEKIRNISGLPQPSIPPSAAAALSSNPASTSAIIPQFPLHLAQPLSHLSQLAGASPSTGLASLRPQEGPKEAKRRFEIECEFVQALANPNYLNFLAQCGFFKEEYFINYLKYLLYFKRPEYARTLKFPQCLFFLEALQSAEFREAIASVENARYIEDQQLLQWHFYMRVRHRLQVFDFLMNLWIFFSKTHNQSNHPQMASSNRTSKLFIYMFAILIAFPTVNPTEYPSEFDRYMPTKCESCLIFANELDADVVRVAPKMPKDEAEAWLLDELEQLCGRMLHYRLHKEKPGLARFSKK